MRNIFDQYSHPENRLTHALVCSLKADSKLLRKFVRFLCGESPSRELEIIEQRLPGEDETDEEEAERRGLPDVWIHDNQTWALIIENKIQAQLRAEQLHKHRRTAERRGYSDIHLVAVVAKPSKHAPIQNSRIITWTELYSWFMKERSSEWPRRFTEYMEVLERKLAEGKYLREGTLTVFSGIQFGKDDPYNYHDAKRLLQLALDKLRTRRELQRKLGVNPKGESRSAITGRDGSSVWNFLPLEKALGQRSFTSYPHLTLSIKREHVAATVTIPNNIRSEFRRNLLTGGKKEFLAMIRKVYNNLHEVLRYVDGSFPYIEILQRHYRTQRSEPIVDAHLQFDLRTAFGQPKRWLKLVKTQPQWIEAVYDVLSNKHSNVQVTIGALFPYDRCPAVHKTQILDHISNTWLACKPLIQRTLN